jgi:hypothetical protein
METPLERVPRARGLLCSRRPRRRRSALRLKLPTIDIPPVPVDADVLFDAYVELAFVAFEWLHRKFGGPALQDASGELGQFASHRD